MNQSLRILIVDDDKRMTRTMADILAMSGYEPVEAHSGQEALEKVKLLFFDCVLTDVRMPGMNGVELFQELRKYQPGLPVILMTAYAAEEIIRKGLEEGVIGVLNKPLDIQALLNFFSSLSKSRIVTVVDDDPAFCQTLGDILEKRGFRVSRVTDPHIAVEKMIEDTQIVMLDMKLNHISGHDVLKEIRAQDPYLPVVLVTGYRQEMSAAVQQALDINAYACLYKPLVIPELLEILVNIQTRHLVNLLVDR